MSALRHRTVLITGGAHGIGAAMVRAFHDADAHVHFCDIDASAGRALAKHLGSNVAFHKLDLTRETQIRRWIRGIGGPSNPIDVLVNNAASDPRIPLERCSAAVWDRLFALNLRAYFLAAKEAARWMIPGSSIINLSSITFHIAPAEMSAYVSTKAGIQGLTRSLARELGPRRIRVNTISPGWVMTDRQLREHVTPAVKRKLRQSQCIPDLIQPQEIASVALFLAGPGSRAITGQELLVDRGWAHS